MTQTVLTAYILMVWLIDGRFTHVLDYEASPNVFDCDLSENTYHTLCHPSVGDPRRVSQRLARHFTMTPQTSCSEDKYPLLLQKHPRRLVEFYMTHLGMNDPLELNEYLNQHPRLANGMNYMLKEIGPSGASALMSMMNGTAPSSKSAASDVALSESAREKFIRMMSDPPPAAYDEDDASAFGIPLPQNLTPQPTIVRQLGPPISTLSGQDFLKVWLNAVKCEI